MPSLLRRCALPLAVALVLLGNAACGGGDPDASRSTGLRDPSVDSSDTRAHRLMRLVARTDTLSTLARALRQAGLDGELQTYGPYTLFAPTDRAFQRYWPGFDSLLAPVGSTATANAARSQPGAASRRGGTPSRTAARPSTDDSLRDVLRFHLVNGRFTSEDLRDSLRLGTLLDESLVLERANSRSGLRVLVKGTSGPVPIQRTVEAQNGVIHIVARPLRIPPPDTSSSGALSPSDTASTSAPAGN